MQRLLLQLLLLLALVPRVRRHAQASWEASTNVAHAIARA
jgi:hypothetical protein